MLNFLEPKTRFIITGTAFAAALFLFGFGILYYAVPKIVQESRAMKQAKASLAALEEEKNFLLGEQEKIKPFSAKIDTVNEAIVPGNNPVAFLGFLEQLADHGHLSIEIKPAPAQNAPPDTLALVVSVTGALKQAINFIKNISAIPFIVTISDITLSQNVTVASSKTNLSAKTVTPVLGETTINITLFAASRP